MNIHRTFPILLLLPLSLTLASPVLAQAPNGPPRGNAQPGGADFPPPDGGPGFDGPPPFAQGGFGPGGQGGPGGPMQQEVKLVKKFDLNGDGWLNTTERQAARASLAEQGGNRRQGGPGGRRGGFGPRTENQEPAKPGVKVTPTEVKSFPDAPLYASNVVRTVFLEFENADWEKELAEFKNTDVDVPAKLIVDGKTYSGVGVHFHGASSFMMVGEGRKRSLVLTLDFIHPDQEIGGYSKLNLLNSHEDPSFLRTVLALDIARDLMPAPKANFMRVVINGESWGLYVNQQHFSKELLKENFATAKGARWKVPGSPNGHAGFNYLGDEPVAYKRSYEIKSKDEFKPWADLAQLCKVLNNTPSENLEKALAPLLDVDGVLKFLAWENVLANGDGFYARASDYSLYEDPSGRFHVLPYDANESFSSGGGPGGPGGMRGFGPGMILAPAIFDEADHNQDGKLTRTEFSALATAWFDQMDSNHTDKVTVQQLSAKLAEILPPPPGFGGGPDGARGGGGGGRMGGGPATFIGPGLFQVLDTDKNGALSRAELSETFAKWFTEWDRSQSGALSEENLRAGLSDALPRPNFAGGPGGGQPGGQPGRQPGGQGGGQPGGRGRGGPGFGGGGVQLDPLVGASDASKPLLSKLLAVPAFRARYLSYVRAIAEKWLDWERLGPLAGQYHVLIADDVKADTRKLDGWEEFANSLNSEPATAGRRSSSLKDFAEKRRAFLLSHPEVKNAAK